MVSAGYLLASPRSLFPYRVIFLVVISLFVSITIFIKQAPFSPKFSEATFSRSEKQFFSPSTLKGLN